MLRLFVIFALGLAMTANLGCSQKEPRPTASQAAATGEDQGAAEQADFNSPVVEAPRRRSSPWDAASLPPSNFTELAENPAPSGGSAAPPSDDVPPHEIVAGRRNSSFLPVEPEIPAESTPPAGELPEDDLAVRGGAAPQAMKMESAPPPQFAPSARLTLRSEVSDDLPPEPFSLDDEAPPAAIPAPSTQPRIRVGSSPQAPPISAISEGQPIFPRDSVRAMGSAQPARKSAPQSDIMPLIPSAAERMGNKDHEVVEVFYATDRKAVHEGIEPAMTVLWRFCPVILLGGGTILCLGIGLQRPQFGIWTAALALGTLTGIWTYVAGSVTTHNARYLAKQGPMYGTERGELRTGVCRVSIPRVHQVGAMEAPSILRLEVKEDARKHLILDGVYPLAEEPFFDRMKARVGSSERRELFVFIHGYNVTFEDAARRTAQMHYDLDYQGAPIFYSWPSQGELFKYTVDETNIAWTTSHFKKFVLDVVAKSDARSINLIAHSMGNRALTGALKDLAAELRSDQKVFNQVVLAAPDIDAEIFKNDIAPAIQKTCENITLYASSHDQALIASKLVHGYPRAGESGKNLIVLPGIDTIDVSEVETNFLGHSYYGDSDVILADVCNLLTESKPPERRGWLTSAQAGTMTYWVFQGAHAATSMPRALRR